MLSWFNTKEKRERWGFVGAAVAAVAVAGWTAYAHFYPRPVAPELSPPAQTEPKPDLSVEVKFSICMGQRRERCPSDAIHLPCGSNPEEQAARRCEKLRHAMTRVRSEAGGACGYNVYDVVCRAAQ